MKVQTELEHERVLHLLAIELYKNPLSFLRELIQNSFDAQSTQITITIDQENKSLIIQDNGIGMNHTFLVQDFKKIGKAFKTDNNEIGLYGIGRLSCFLVSNNITIETLDNIISWESLKEYDLNKNDQYIEGTKYTLKVNEGKEEVLSYWRIQNYLKSNIILPLTITIKEGLRESEHVPQTQDHYKNRVNAKLDAYIISSENWSQIKIFEKGLLVREDWNNTFNIILNYHRAIKTLSRESVTLTHEQIQRDIYKSYLEYIKDNESVIENLIKPLSKLAIDHKDKSLAKKLIVNGKTLAYYKKNKYYFSLPSIYVERAKALNYRVLVLKDESLIECCRLIGLRDLVLIQAKLRNKAITGVSEGKKGIELLKASSDFLEIINTMTEQLLIQEVKTEDNTSIINIVEHEEITELKKELSLSDSVPTEIKVVNEDNEIKMIFGSLGYGYTEPSIRAFQYGDKIILNLNNELIQTALDLGDFEILRYTLIHEYTHKVIGHSRHDKSFDQTLNLLHSKWLIEKAKTQRTILSKVIAQKAGKYTQFKINLPKQLVIDLELIKGSEITLTISK
jgi:hypothetical protein